MIVSTDAAPYFTSGQRARPVQPGRVFCCLLTQGEKGLVSLYDEHLTQWTRL